MLHLAAFLALQCPARGSWIQAVLRASRRDSFASLDPARRSRSLARTGVLIAGMPHLAHADFRDLHDRAACPRLSTVRFRPISHKPHKSGQLRNTPEPWREPRRGTGRERSRSCRADLVAAPGSLNGRQRAAIWPSAASFSRPSSQRAVASRLCPEVWRRGNLGYATKRPQPFRNGRRHIVVRIVRSSA